MKTMKTPNVNPKGNMIPETSDKICKTICITYTSKRKKFSDSGNNCNSK